MEQIRLDALSTFNERFRFTEDAQYAHILDQEPGISLAPRWKPYAESELIEQTRCRITANESILICISLAGKNITLNLKRRLFMELVDAFQIDHAVLRPLSSIECAFCHIFGTQNETFYVRIASDILIWSFDIVSHTSRGFLLAYHHTWPLDTREQANISDIGSKIKENIKLLDQPFGLLWLYFLYGLKHTKQLNDNCWSILEIVENGTGYGKPLRSRDSVNPDIYTEWSKDVARAAVDLARVNRYCEHMRAIFRELMRVNGSGQPLFRDKRALLMAKGHLGNEIIKTRFLSERAKNQMFVLFNLIARADTRASVELTKVSKELTEDNLTIARATKNDSGAMKTISIMTMLFLPATFFAALFSMPILQWNESPVVRKKFWVYWAFTIPITVLVFFVWWVTTYLPPIRSFIDMDIPGSEFKGRNSKKQLLKLRTNLELPDHDIS